MKSITRPMVWRGILAIIVGIIAIAWPGITVWALVVIFAVYAFLVAAMEAARAFSDRAGPVAGHLLLALLYVAAGVIALAWPDITALAFALLIAVWAFVIGFFEIYLAFAAGGTAGERALLGLTGLILIALGVVFASRPDVGADDRRGVRPVQPRLGSQHFGCRGEYPQGRQACPARPADACVAARVSPPSVAQPR